MYLYFLANKNVCFPNFMLTLSREIINMYMYQTYNKRNFYSRQWKSCRIISLVTFIHI